jgi:catechol 2,3-dioxygenase-like lactoylglutathione lyase family enzyme
VKVLTDFIKIVPVLKVSDMRKSLDLYTRVLGFQVAWQAGNDGCGENCMLSAGSTNLLLSTGSHLGNQPQFTGTLYFHVAGVQEYYDRIKDRVTIAWPLEVMEYGQHEFGIRDCDGYMLAFAEDVEH